MPDWVARWSGKFPALRFGEWRLFRDGVEVDVEIPFKNDHANTEVLLYDWTPDNGFYQYREGLAFEEWAKKNEDFLLKLADPSEWAFIYEAFQRDDWRSFSCE